MADVILRVPGSASAPLTYQIPASQVILPKIATASFNGVSAAGSFVPALQLLDATGTVLHTFTCGSALAAGASADVSWFPGVGSGGASSGGGSVRDIIVRANNINYPIATGIMGEFSVDFACTIKQWTLLADTAGSAVVDIWKTPFASYPPTVANSITAAAPPTLSAAASAQSSTLTGWTTAVSADDTFRVNVNSVSGLSRLTLMVQVQ